MRRHRRRFGGLVCVVATSASTVSACANASPSGPSCEPTAANTLVSTRMVSRLAPGPAFAVPSGAEVWVESGSQPGDGDEGLFAGVGGIGDVSALRDGGTPSITTDASGTTSSNDPTVTLRKTGAWVRLPIGAGSWQLYTDDMAPSFLVTVIACR